ncbi:hypothetical protein ASPCAL04959 [Aspergillus calidoustus]|uniref:F-box domain-containing protein n=2 Tax=Aspergillus calidoustus TaxID=454130 RepID=A0A0U5G043_ASPCI|nr:hypothetical protein ASPCAL04959 [Aspergillus calidoustus]
MGYSEAYCHLCGVSFNISRYRQVGEPEIATYGSSDGMDAEIECLELEECMKNGCTFVLKFLKEEDDDLENDPDYEPDEADYDGKLYEYGSDYESDDAMSISAEDEHEQEDSTEEDALYRDFLSKTIHRRPRVGEPVGAYLFSPETQRTDTLIPITSESLPEEYDPEDLEHLPGPGCRQALAYPGASISLAEMRGCRTAQFLVHKTCGKGKWKPDGFNEDWEMGEDWFLSGVCDGMTSRDCGFPTVWPARGGVAVVAADNINFNPGQTDPNSIAMPFHPWCFDIFARQSKVHFGRVNVDGLMKWRNAESGYEEFHEFPRIADVFEAQEQWWEHVPGKEYLAANPLYVPGLPALLRGAAATDGGMHHEGLPVTGGGIDRLGALPLDLRLLIVSFLGSDDITNLRAASRAFTHLPNGVWYRLVRQDMPWLFEAWDEEIQHTPSFWTTMTANEIKYVDNVRERYSTVLRNEHMGEDGILDHLLPWQRAVTGQIKLPKATTNWHQVYVQIKGNWGNLKGLRNRQRIWEDMEEIIRRIRKYENQSGSARGNNDDEDQDS